MLTLLAPSRLHYLLRRTYYSRHTVPSWWARPYSIAGNSTRRDRRRGPFVHSISLSASRDQDSIRRNPATSYSIRPTAGLSLSHTHSLPPAPTNPFSRVELECAEPVSPVLVGSEPGQLSTFCSSHRQPEALLQAFVSRHRLPYCCAGTLSHRSRLPFPALPCPALPSPSSSPYITYLHARTRSRRLDSLSTVQCIGLGWRKTRAIPTEFHRRQQREWGVSSPPLHPSSPARRISSHCTATDPIVWYLSDLH